MFKGIVVRNYQSQSDEIVKEWTVPIMWGGIDKTQRDSLEDHYFESVDISATVYTPFENTPASATNTYYRQDTVERGQRFYECVPRMSLVMGGMTFDPSRAYGSTEWRNWILNELDIPESVIEDYQPTPYNIDYTLFIKTNSMDHFSQIMENILPFFNPQDYIRVKEFSFLNVERDIPIKLNSVTPEFVEDMQNNDRRYINATLSFTAQAFLYRPWIESHIIKYIKTNYYMKVPYTSATPMEVFNTSGYHSVSGVIVSGDVSAIPTSYNFSGIYDGSAGEVVYFVNKVD